MDRACGNNLQPAIPVTFGYRIAGLLSAIERHRERLLQLRSRVLVGEFAGAAGVLASLNIGAMEPQAGLMHELGLGQPLIAWQTIYDSIVEVGAFPGLVGGTLGQAQEQWKKVVQAARPTTDRALARPVPSAPLDRPGRLAAPLAPATGIQGLATQTGHFHRD